MKINLPQKILFIVYVMLFPFIIASCDYSTTGNHNGNDLGVSYIQEQLDYNKKCPVNYKHRYIVVQVLSINDFHGQIGEGRYVSDRPVGSAPILTAYLKEAANGMEDNTFMVSAGDLVGASMPSSSLLQDGPAIAFFNLLGNRFADKPWKKFHPQNNLVIIPGNHEFDEGQTELKRLIYGGNHEDGPFIEDPYQGSNAPMICANIVYEENGKPFLPPFIIKSVQGIPVAFIGADVRDTPTIVTKSGIEGLAFLDEAESINKYTKILKRFGIHAIIAVIHEGASQNSYNGATDENIPLPTGKLIDIVKNLDDDVDVVIGGHTHAFCNALVPNNNGKKILVTQAWSKGSAFSDIDLVIDRRTRDITKKSAQIITTWADEGTGLTPDPKAAELLELANQLVGPIIEKVITTAAVDITRDQSPAGESALGNLIADAQRSTTGTDFAFMNPGGIRDEMYAGDVTWGELYTIQPFNNYLVTMDLTGQQIYDLLNQQWYNQPYPRILQISGLSYTWDMNKPENDFIVEVRDANGVIDKSATYSVTVNSFLAEGGDNFTVLTNGTNRVIGMIDLDALVLYVESLSGPVSSLIEGRIEVIQ